MSEEEALRPLHASKVSLLPLLLSCRSVALFAVWSAAEVRKATNKAWHQHQDSKAVRLPLTVIHARLLEYTKLTLRGNVLKNCMLGRRYRANKTCSLRPAKAHRTARLYAAQGA